MGIGTCPAAIDLRVVRFFLVFLGKNSSVSRILTFRHGRPFLHGMYHSELQVKLKHFCN